MNFKELFKKTVFCLGIIGAAVHASEEPTAKRQKKVHDKYLLIKFVDINGVEREFSAHQYQVCAERSVFLKNIFSDPQIKDKVFKLPITFDELNEFILFCRQGGGIPQYKIVWQSEPNGFTILAKLGYNIFQHPGIKIKRLLFNFPVQAKQVAISEPLLYQLFLNFQGSPKFDEWYEKFRNQPEAVIQIDKQFDEADFIPLLPLIFTIASVVPPSRLENVFEILMLFAKKQNYSLEKLESAVAEIVPFTFLFLELDPLSNFLERIGYSLTLFQSWKNLDEQELFNKIIESIRGRESDETKPYAYAMKSIVFDLHLMIKLAIKFGSAAFIKSFEQLQRTVRPHWPCDICDTLDNQMLFVRLILLLNFKQLGYEKWMKKYQGEFGLYLLHWSKDLKKRDPKKSRIYFEEQIFENFVEDMHLIGLDDDEEDDLRSKVHLSEEREINVEQIAREIHPLPENIEHYQWNPEEGEVAEAPGSESEQSEPEEES